MLDFQQKQIVDLRDSRALVLAGPGCGKTHLLARRILKAHASDNVPFADMICLTFTNRASREMVSRIKVELGHRPEDLFIGNLHSFCCRFLTANKLLRDDFSLLDDVDRDSWLSDTLSAKRKFERKQIVDLSVLLYQQQHDFPEHIRRRLDFKPSEPVIRAAEAYLQFKTANNLIDFDDLLLLTYTALSTHRSNSFIYSNYRWIQVDEVQDLTPLQLEIIDLITAFGPTTVLYLGDEQQAIFRFIGAGGPALDMIKQRCSDSIYRLTRNYRSPGYLVDLCNDYASQCLDLHSDYMPEAADNTIYYKTGNLSLMPASDFNLPLAVAAKARSLLSTENDGRIAILTRTNDEAEDISAVLKKNGIEHTLIARNDLFRSVDYKTICAHLAVVAGSRNPSDWARLLHRTKSVTNLSEARSLAKRLISMSVSPACLIDTDSIDNPSDELKRFLSSFVVTNVSKKFKESYGDLYRHSRELIAAASDSSGISLVAEMDYAYNYFLTNGAIGKIEKWESVKNFLSIVFGNGRHENFASALHNHILELHSFNEGDMLENDRLTVITIHKAKGLEFDDVIIYNADSRPASSADSDSKVYYVAISRARRSLSVFHTGRLIPQLASVKSHFTAVNENEVEATALIERLHNRHRYLKSRIK